MERKSCYNCKWYGMWLGDCMNNLSPFWAGWVTMDDVCEEWEEDEEDEEL